MLRRTKRATGNCIHKTPEAGTISQDQADTDRYSQGGLVEQAQHLITIAKKANAEAANCVRVQRRQMAVNYADISVTTANFLDSQKALDQIIKFAILVKISRLP